MPCIRLGNDAIVCGFHPRYEFRGHLFELHSYCGPTPLNRRTGDPRVTIPTGFWRAWDVFKALSSGEQAKYVVED